MTVGEYLKELRQAKNISQKELSGLTNGEVSNAEISRLEAGIRKKPSPAILKLLAPHLSVPVSVLLAKAGYMDDPQGGEVASGAGTGAGSNTGSGREPGGAYMERLQALEDERITLKKANQALTDDEETLRDRLRQLETTHKSLEDKYNELVKGGPQAGKSGNEIEEENRVLRERNEKLLEENRRIKEETIAFLEEGSSLRAEADGYRKKMTTAEEAARKAKLAQETLEEELRALKDKGVMFTFESDEERESEYTRLKNEMMGLLEQKNTLTDEKNTLNEKIRQLESRLTEATAGGAGQDAGQDGGAALAALEKDLTEYKDLLAASEAERDQYAKDKALLEQQLAASKETAKLSAPMLESISGLQGGGMDIGKIFIETVKDAGADDLDMLGRLMQAMNKDAIKASDKRMLMDILKRFIK